MAKYSPGRRKKKQDPMLVGMCVFGAVVLIAIPVVSKVLFSHSDDKVKETEIVGWSSNDKGEPFYYLENHKKAVGQTAIGDDTYFFDEDGGVTPGWRKHDKKLFYVQKDGKISTGLTHIKDDLYFFNEASDEKAFEMFKGGLKVVAPEKEKPEIKKVYYFDTNGKAIKGQKVTSSGDAYYFGADYSANVGWFEADVKVMTLNDKEISSEAYNVLSDAEKESVQTVDAKKYFYADEEGKLQRGWIESNENGVKSYHYLSDDYYGASGKYTCTFNGKEMEFDFKDTKGTYIPSNNTPADTKPVTTTVKETQKTTEKAPDNTPGWHTDNDGTKYYINQKNERAKGFTDIDGKKYIFNNQGIMQTGKYEDYYADANGVLQSGYLEIDCHNYLYDETTYKMKKGLQILNGRKYFFDPDGRQVISGFRSSGNDVYYFSYLEGGAAVTGFITIGRDNYWFDDEGRRQYGWHKFSDNGAIYYFAPDNEGKMATGYKQIDDKMYYFNPYGALLLDFVEMNGTVYYFGNDGAIVEGDYEYQGKVYHFGNDGRMGDPVEPIITEE